MFNRKTIRQGIKPEYSNFKQNIAITLKWKLLQQDIVTEADKGNTVVVVVVVLNKLNYVPKAEEFLSSEDIQKISKDLHQFEPQNKNVY